MKTRRIVLACVISLACLSGLAAPTVQPVAADTCNWTGIWDTGKYGMLEMAQTGDLVTGAYTWSGRVGRLAGKNDADLNALAGEWTEEPAPEGQGKGLFAFLMAPDCNSFAGAYGYGSSTDAAGEWSATRVR